MGRKTNNKLYLYLLASIFVVSLCICRVNASEFENYYGIEMNNQQYNNLLNLGFTENEIYYMNEETFELNKDISSTLVARNEKFYKTVYTDLNGNSITTEITEDEYNNQSLMDPRGTVTTTYKNMISTMSKLDNTFRYKVTVGWNRIPSTRSYDIIGVGFSDNVTISSDIYFTYTYADGSGNYSTSTLHYGKKSISTGGSAVYKVPSGDLNSLSAVLYYDVAKKSSGTITRLDMYGDYAHATSNVTSSQYSNHTINSNGIVFYGDVQNYYDEIPCAVSSWSGTW